MGNLAGFKYRKIAKRLQEFGFVLHRKGAGSHEIWCNIEQNTCITIPKHSKDMPEFTLKQILKQAGVSENDFLNA